MSDEKGEIAARTVALVYVPDTGQHAIFSSQQLAMIWAEAQPEACVTLWPLVIDAPEFGNMETGAMS